MLASPAASVRRIAGLLAVLAVLAMLAGPAMAEETNVYTNSNTNQHGMNLPIVPQPSGQDQLRTSGGTMCSSAQSTGAYVDVGAIGSQDRQDSHVGSLYARVVIPLGRRPKRIDCEKRYALVIERLRMELEMMRMGLGAGMLPEDMTVMGPEG